MKSILCYLAIAGTAVTWSCKEDEETPLTNGSDIKEEAVTDYYFQDIDDLGSISFDFAEDEDYRGAEPGRRNTTIDVDDYRICDDTDVTITLSEGSSYDNPKGVLVIDFGTTGCTDAKGNTRKGIVKFTYAGRRFVSGSTVVTTFENYSVNGIILKGTRTSTNVSTSTEQAPAFRVELENGEAIFPDQSTAERESTIYWKWVRGANPLSDQLIVETGSVANGKTREGTLYEVEVTEELVYKRFCSIAVSGVKEYTINSELEITLDYGDGECDRVIKVTTPRMTRSITL